MEGGAGAGTGIRAGTLRHATAAAAAVIATVAAVAIAACGPPAKAREKRVGTAQPASGKVQYGLGSWYGGRHHGGPTASGERYNRHAMTAAHRTLQMNTRVRVTNQRNGRSVIVRINDRGPYVKGRIIDVSEAAAAQLWMKEAGIVPVKVERLP